MLRFFRQIRQRLLTDNKFSKYLLYAVGEIILVVLGILIALQLNIGYEEGKQQILEKQYLTRLIEDLKQDSEYYSERIEQAQRVIVENRKTIQSMYQTQESVEDVKALFSAMTWPSEDLTTQNATYIDLINSGNLNIIQNQPLKTSIIQYYKENERAAKLVSEFDEVSTRHLIHLGQIYPNRIKLQDRFKDIFEDLPLFEEDWEAINDPGSEKFQMLTFTLAIYKIKHEDYLEHFIPLRDLTSELVAKIYQELELRN